MPAIETMPADTEEYTSGRFAGLARRGWTFRDVRAREDMGGLGDPCDVCDRWRLKCVHTVDHTWNGTWYLCLRCCEGLTGDRVKPRKHEASLKQKLGRAAWSANWRAHWSSKPWQRSARGNLWKAGVGYHVVVFARYGGGYSCRVNNALDPQVYPTAEAAMEACFLAVSALRVPDPVKPTGPGPFAVSAELEAALDAALAAGKPQELAGAAGGSWTSV
jgi:hypothetical protein